MSVSHVQQLANPSRAPEMRCRSLQEEWMELYPGTCLPLSLKLGREVRATIYWAVLNHHKKSLFTSWDPSTLKLVQNQKLLKKLPKTVIPASAGFSGMGQFGVAQQWPVCAASDTSLSFSSCFYFFYSFLFLCNVLSLFVLFFPPLQHILPLLTIIPLFFYARGCNDFADDTLIMDPIFSIQWFLSGSLSEAVAELSGWLKIMGYTVQVQMYHRNIFPFGLCLVWD